MDKGPDGHLPITVFTLDVEAPSAPLFFRFLHETSSCLYLAWDPPFYDGGREIVDYVIYYTVNEVTLARTAPLTLPCCTRLGYGTSPPDIILSRP